VTISIKNLTRKPAPRVGFEFIKDKIVGKKYELSVVLCGPATSRKLNRALRGKNRPTNVLSFPLSKNSGEIFLDLTQAKLEYKNFEMPFVKFVTYLYIHGLLHLKGMEHGARMDRAEKKFLKLINGKTNHSGN
jgi:rRNA maturation RNase YbeY